MKEMKKNLYITPEIETIHINTNQLMAGSLPMNSLDENGVDEESKVLSREDFFDFE